ncbi:Triacylglycerol lipase SDP1 isoform A [Micractinium conductrix]|uniref:Triacylglycerol lipase SDP1 isoform A n=1 Tax=Micractinium conductrix TaxID=554055 RepID=A0A2P6VPC1_9CHLO|nr:Triacylglycerol lipase SDP1 isoform A [Micractinium conductrix]|eukprot:PSC75941.1 Triacylglycerol lipase SDP1 isoform A [Micractinium conductrix]
MAAASGVALQALLRALREPTLLKSLLLLGAPLRLAVAANLWAGRTLRSLAAELARRLMALAGWLHGRLQHPRLRRVQLVFERAAGWPLRRWHLALAALVAGKAALWAGRWWAECSSGLRQRRRAAQRRMAAAGSYDEWAEAAQELESLRGLDPRSRFLLETSLYDRRLLYDRVQYLQRVRKRGDVTEVMFALRADLLRNLGNMTNSALHERFPAVPDLIRQYNEQVAADLQYVASSPDLPLDERLAFLRESRHAFGRTALVLSGGGSFGSFHLGIVKALLDANMLPRVVSGSSAGAIVSAILCTRSEPELQEVFESLRELGSVDIDFYSFNTLSQIVKHILLKGTLQDHTVLQERLRRVLGDLTFAEAYHRSGRILNVSVSAADTTEPPRLLNYLTAPNVLVWSAVACSSAFPFLYAPQQLLARDSRGEVVGLTANAAGEMQRRWRDGSLEEDLPMRGLSEMFNVNYFIVSQANPYVLPLMALKRLVPRRVGNLIEGEMKHRCKQLMDVLPTWLGANRLLKLVNQPWEGDLTMVLPFTTFSTAKSVVNLSRADLLLALEEGKRATWAKLSAIQANCAIEAAIDECLRQTAAFAAAQRRRAARRSIRVSIAGSGGVVAAPPMHHGLPSWLHMPALGMPRSESREGVVTPSGPTPSASSKGAFFAESPRASMQAEWDAAEVQHAAVTPRRAWARNSQSSGALLQLAVQDTLMDTFVVEDAAGERAEAEEGEETAERQAAEVAAEASLVEASGEAAPSPPRQLESGRELWRDLLSLLPAATEAGGTGLDFIAP